MSLAEEWGPGSPEDSLAKSVARSVHGTVPVIAGAELAAAAAYRWKTQFNQNTSLPAFASVLPEADHNEVVGWEAACSLGRFSYVSLEDPGASAQRAAGRLTAEIAGAGAVPVLRVDARGVSPVERLVSLVLLGDLVSIYAAVLRDADPVDIPAIDGLKAALPRGTLGEFSVPEDGCWPATVLAMSSIASEPASGAAGALNVASIVGGEARADAPGGTLTSTNPAARRRSSPRCSLGDASTFVDAARAARAAQKEWAAVPAPARGRVIAQVGRLVEANKEALAGSSRARSASRTRRRWARSRRSSTPATSSSARAGGSTGRPCRRRCPQAALHVPDAGRRRGDHHRGQLPGRGPRLVPRAGDPVRQRGRVEAGGVQRRAR